MKINEILSSKESCNIQILNNIIVSHRNDSYVLILQEGKWVRGRFEKNIRIDHPTHGVGQTHAHIFGRKGQELGVVNIDGTGSHGTKCKLNDIDADALRDMGFTIKKGNIVEWALDKSLNETKLLLG